MNDKKGFTLAELLVALGIICILVAVMVPAIIASAKQINYVSQESKGLYESKDSSIEGKLALDGGAGKIPTSINMYFSGISMISASGYVVKDAISGSSLVTFIADDVPADLTPEEYDDRKEQLEGEGARIIGDGSFIDVDEENGNVVFVTPGETDQEFRDVTFSTGGYVAVDDSGDIYTYNDATDTWDQQTYTDENGNAITHVNEITTSADGSTIIVAYGENISYIDLVTGEVTTIQTDDIPWILNRRTVEEVIQVVADLDSGTSPVTIAVCSDTFWPITGGHSIVVDFGNGDVETYTGHKIQILTINNNRVTYSPLLENENITCIQKGTMLKSGQQVPILVACTDAGRILQWEYDDIAEWGKSNSIQWLQCDAANYITYGGYGILYYPEYSSAAYGNGWWVAVGDNFINKAYYQANNTRYYQSITWNNIAYTPTVPNANRFYFNNNTNLPITFNSVEYLDDRFYAVGGYTLNGTDYGVIYYSDPVVNSSTFAFNWKIAKVVDAQGNPVSIDTLYAIAGVNS